MLNALELSASIKSKKISVQQTVESYLNCINKKNPTLNTFITIDTNDILERAQKVQHMIDEGKPLSPLTGVPIAIKDNISVTGMPTTCGSKMLSTYTPIFNATVIDRLEQAGMVIIGKLNMDEFAMGSSNETSYYGVVRNPWDTQRVPGGSSGGSAAAIASGQTPLALGSDTGGSIRQPCSFCGITGIKPTYGAVSRYGLVAFASSLDQIGPMGQNIEDCAALLSIISGPCQKDATCIIEKPFDFIGQPSPDNLNQLKIGVPSNYLDENVSPDVRDCILQAAKQLEQSGAYIDYFQMPMMDYVVATYYIIACAEASSNLSRYDGLKYGYRSEHAEDLQQLYRMSRSEGFGMEVKRRIMMGSFVLSSGYYDAYYQKALQSRALIKQGYDNIFQKFDMILSPVTPSTAYKIGEKIGDPMKMYMCDIFTSSANLAGLPAVALPCGFDSDGLPIGLQLTGDAFSEGLLINAARLYQNITDHHKKQPGGDISEY